MIALAFSIAVIVANSFIIVATQGLNETRKTLELLAFISYTGNVPRDGKICQAAMDVAVSAVNKDVAFLPGYRINVTYLDEGELAKVAPKLYVNFVRQFEDRRPSNRSSYLAPVVVGTFLTCQANARVIRSNYMVQFSTQCGGVAFTANRKDYPNLYRNRIPYDSLPFVQISFMRRVGKWSQIGMLSYAGNVNQFYNALAYYSAALRLGIDVVWFGNYYDITSDITNSILASDTRILAVLFTEVGRLINFFCLAYMNGITGDTYLFFTLPIVLFDPATVTSILPKGCNQKMLEQQMKYSIWLGPTEEAPMTDIGKTSLGYDLAEFERRVDSMTNSSRNADYVQRHRCHDTMEQALMSLIGAERTLKTQYNMTLSDFQDQPVAVMNVVNRTAASMNISGVRIGELRYSERLELDFEPQYAGQWINGKMRYTHRVVYLGTNAKQILNISSYKVEQFADIIWFTKSKQPPKDLAQVVQVSIRTPESLQMAVVFVAGLFLAFELAALCILSWKRKKLEHQFVNNFVLLFGCMAVNGGAVALISQRSSSICLAEPVLVVLGASVQISNIIGRLVMLYKELLKVRPGSGARRRTTRSAGTSFLSRGASSFISRSSMRPSSLASAARKITSIKSIRSNSKIVDQPARKTETPSEKPATFDGKNPISHIITVSVTLSSVLALIIWLAYDPPTVKSVKSPILYDSQFDNYYQEERVECSSAAFQYWGWILFGYLTLVCVVGGYFTYMLRHFTWAPSTVKVELTTTRIAATNQLPIAIAVAAVWFIMQTPTIRSVVLSFGLIIFTNSVALIITIPLFVILFGKVNALAPAS